MPTRLQELREKYSVDDRELDPKPVVYKGAGGNVLSRYADWASATSEEDGDEFFEPQPMYCQDRSMYSIPIEEDHD